MKIQKTHLKKYVWEPTLYVWHVFMALAGLRSFQDKQGKKMKSITPLCANCGGVMEFVKDERSGSDEKVLLKCGKCEFVRDLRAESVKPVSLSSFFDIRKQNQGLHTGDTIYESEKGKLPANQTCNAQIVIQQAHQSTEACPFCGMPLKERPSEKNSKKSWSEKGPEETVIYPHSIIPFSVSFQEVKDKFNGWLKKDTFLSPSLLNDIVQEQSIIGIYIPFFFLKEAKFRVSWYLAPEIEDKGKGKGKEDRIYFTSGYFETKQDSLLSSASSGIPNDLINGINDFNLKELVDFAPGYLEGWSYELYTKSVDRTLKNWQKNKINKSLNAEVKKRVYNKRPEELKVASETFYMDLQHIFLPVWVALYTYRGKAYQFLVNGQTGKVFGEKPKSPRKIFLLMTVIISFIIGMVVLADLLWHR